MSDDSSAQGPEVTEQNRITVRDPDTGVLGNVLESELDEAIAQGFEVPTQQEVEAAKQEARQEALSGPLQKLLTARERASGSFLIPGLTDQLAAEFPEAAELVKSDILTQLAEREAMEADPSLAEEGLVSRMRQRDETNEIAGAAGRLGGFAAGLAVPLPGAKGASGGRLLRGLGQATEQAVARGGASAAERIGVKALGEGVTGAAEGALFEAGNVVSEDALGQADLTANRLVAEMGVGSVLGFGGGAIIGGTLRAGGEGIGALASKAKATTRRGREAVASMLRAQTGTEPADRAVRWYTRVLEKTHGRDTADQIEALLNDPEGRRLIREGSDVLDTAQVRIADQVDAIERASDDASEFAIKLKRGSVEPRLRAMDDRMAGEARAVLGELQDLAQRIDDAGSRGAFEGAGFARKKIFGLVDEATDAVERGIERGGQKGAADVFLTLDNVKRGFGRLTKRAKRIGGFVGEEFEGRYHRIRQSLEDSEVFGEQAADLQRELNAAFSPLISNSSVFRKRFMEKAGEKAGFDELQRASTQALDTYLRRVGTGAARNMDETFQRQIALQRQFFDTIEKHYDLPQGLKGRIDEARGAAQKLDADFDEVRRAVSAKNLVEGLQNQAVNMEGSLATAGAFIGGGPGALIGSAGGKLLSNPAANVRTLAAIKNKSDEFATRLTKRTDNYVKRLTKKKPPKPIQSGSRRTGKAPATIESFEDTVDTVMEATAQPEKTAKTAEERLERVATAAPNVAAHASLTAQRGMAFLRARVPALAQQKRGSLTPHLEKRAEPSDAAKAKFMRYAHAVNDPETILDELDSGRLTRETVEAVREVYPRIYEDVVAQVQRSLAEAEKPVPYDERLRLGLLLDAPTDPSLEPAFIARMQQIAQTTQPQSQAADLQSLDVGGQQASEMQRLLQRRTAS